LALLIFPLISSVVNPYRVTVGFGLDAVGCVLLNLAAREPLSDAPRRWASFLSRPPLVWLGSISYSLYLMQQQFLISWNTTFSGRLPLSLLAILACALISFHWIEMPGLRAKQLFSRSTL
jgi:peptidoglycan/LPS O-acetylase OafA/YrhL